MKTSKSSRHISSFQKENNEKIERRFLATNSPLKVLKINQSSSTSSNLKNQYLTGRGERGESGQKSFRASKFSLQTNTPKKSSYSRTSSRKKLLPPIILKKHEENNHQSNGSPLLHLPQPPKRFPIKYGTFKELFPLSNKNEFNKFNNSHEDIKQKTSIGFKTRSKSRKVSYEKSKFEVMSLFKKSNFSSFSKPGKSEKQDPKENQDSYVLERDIFENIQFHIYGVMDGHGVNGHFVSKFIADKICKYFENKRTYITRKGSEVSQNFESFLDENHLLEKLKFREHILIKKFFKNIQLELEDEKFDVHYSGSTCILIFHIDNTLVISNIGDSRAIAIKYFDALKEYTVEELSHDHKPENPEEKERIEKNGGEVHQCKEDDGEIGGPYRVWAKNEKYPGLAMSRSLGDTVAKSIGVIYDPDITVKNIDNTYKCLVLASDGVWEFLSNEDVMKIIQPYYEKKDADGGSKAIVEKARELWMKEDVIIDDITVVVVFL